MLLPFITKGLWGHTAISRVGLGSQAPLSRLSQSQPPWPGPKDAGSGVSLSRPPVAEAGGRGVGQLLLLGFQDVEGLRGEAADHGVGVFVHGP